MHTVEMVPNLHEGQEANRALLCRGESKAHSLKNRCKEHVAHSLVNALDLWEVLEPLHYGLFVLCTLLFSGQLLQVSITEEEASMHET